MPQGHNRILKHQHTNNSMFLNSMDKFMYVIALIAPVMTIPQLIDVLQGNTKGVSPLTWGAYAFVSALWCIYGIFHKDKPLILTQFLLLILDGAIFFIVLIG